MTEIKRYKSAIRIRIRKKNWTKDGALGTPAGRESVLPILTECVLPDTYQDLYIVTFELH